MLDASTKILGLIGYPLEHSYSPLIHNQAIQRLGLNYVYLSLPVKPAYLEEALKAIRVFNFRGVNVTIPYKERVIPYLDELDPLAEKVGAVNTILNAKGILKGYNTDVSGFQKMLKKEAKFKIKGSKALIIGAGGAARAVGVALCQEGIAHLTFLNRTLEKAQNLIADLSSYYPGVKFASHSLQEKNEALLKEADLIVNATPLGMHPQTHLFPPLNFYYLRPGSLAVDLVYNPPQTRFMQLAALHGAKTINGQAMLIYQAMDSFFIWTGRKGNYQLFTPDVDKK